MQVGELISEKSLEQEYELKCPFDEDEPGGPEAGTENISKDDKDAAEEAQKNNGGTLGQNLSKGKKGKADGGPYPPDDYLVEMKPYDTKREKRKGCKDPRIHFRDYRDAKEGDFPFVLGAHHLIPGNASLKNAKELVKFMKKGGKVKSKCGRRYTIKYHIGYDINGAHNGVWLPANYAIKTAKPEKKIKRGKKTVTVPAQEGTTPLEGVSWRKLSANHEEWQKIYVAATIRAIGAQFHDAHTDYNEHVLEMLIKISTQLAAHLQGCEICQKEGKKKIPPPYRIKRRLFGLSKRLRYYLMGNPAQWKKTLVTSDRWAKHYFYKDEEDEEKYGKVERKFLRASVGRASVGDKRLAELTVLDELKPGSRRRWARPLPE